MYVHSRARAAGPVHLHYMPWASRYPNPEVHHCLQKAKHLVTGVDNSIKSFLCGVVK